MNRPCTLLFLAGDQKRGLAHHDEFLSASDATGFPVSPGFAGEATLDFPLGTTSFTSYTLARLANGRVVLLETGRGLGERPLAVDGELWLVPTLLVSTLVGLANATAGREALAPAAFDHRGVFARLTSGRDAGKLVAAVATVGRSESFPDASLVGSLHSAPELEYRREAELRAGEAASFLDAQLAPYLDERAPRPCVRVPGEPKLVDDRAARGSWASVEVFLPDVREALDGRFPLDGSGAWSASDILAREA